MPGKPKAKSPARRENAPAGAPSPRAPRGAPALLAASLVGAGCASGGLGAGARGRSAAAPELVGEASLGPLAIRKWRLANGLEIILAPDASARSLSYMTFFRVGSRNENEAAGETGLAHLFEHLMFTQTKTVPAGEFDRRLEAVGANVNAMTYYDFTAYVNNVPPQALDLVAGLEADRMVNLTLTREQVETERDVVSEERLSTVEDSVDGTVDELLYKQAFTRHPYRWPVIGWMKDIKSVTREKALRFYRSFYAPNNAVLVLAGPLDPEATLATLRTHYERLAPSRDLPADASAPEAAPATASRLEITRPVPADRVAIALPAPGLGAADRAAYEVLQEILLGGPSARLPRRLIVEAEIASSVTGDVAPTRDPGLFTIWVQLKPGHTASQAEAAVEAALASLATTAVPAAELDTAKARLETELWSELASSEGRAERLGTFEVSAGGFARVFGRVDERRRVTPADLQRVARQHFTPERRAVIVVHPSPPSS